MLPIRHSEVSFECTALLLLLRSSESEVRVALPVKVAARHEEIASAHLGYVPSEAVDMRLAHAPHVMCRLAH